MIRIRQRAKYALRLILMLEAAIGLNLNINCWLLNAIFLNIVLFVLLVLCTLYLPKNNVWLHWVKIDFCCIEPSIYCFRRSSDRNLSIHACSMKFLKLGLVESSTVTLYLLLRYSFYFTLLLLVRILALWVNESRWLVGWFWSSHYIFAAYLMNLVELLHRWEYWAHFYTW